MATASRGPEAAAEGAAERLSRWALRVLQAGAIAGVVAALPYTTFDLDRHLLPKELVLHLAGFTAAGLCLARARRITVSLADALIAGFLLVSLLSAIAATNHWLSFRSLGITLSGALVFWSARALSREGLARPLVGALAVGVAVAALLGLLQAYGVESSLWAERRAPGGTFGNRNFMAHFLALGLPVFVLFVLEGRRRWELGVTVAGTTLLAAALVLSRSRAAWLGVGVSLVLLVVEGLWAGGLWGHRTSRGRVLALLGAAVVGIVLALALPNTLAWRSDSPYLDSLRGIADYREGSGRGRLVQYENTLRMAADHPVLGVGPGNWPVAYPKYTFPGDPAFDANDFIPTNPWPSSDWIAYLSERGAVALTLLLLAGAALAIGAWRRWRRAADPTERLESLAVVLTLAVLGVVSSLDAVLLLPTPTFFAWAALGVLSHPPKRPLFRISLSAQRSRRLLNATALVGTLLVVRSLGQIAGMAVFSEGRRISTLEWAARIDPGSYRMEMLLAYAWRSRNRCPEARLHAEAARQLFPNHPAPAALLVSCRRPR